MNRDPNLIVQYSINDSVHYNITAHHHHTPSGHRKTQQLIKTINNSGDGQQLYAIIIQAKRRFVYLVGEREKGQPHKCREQCHARRKELTNSAHAPHLRPVRSSCATQSGPDRPPRLAAAPARSACRYPAASVVTRHVSKAKNL